MDKKKVQSILQDALEEKIPSQEIDLWRAVRTSLVAGTNQQQGEKMNITQPRRFLRIVYSALAIVALLTLAFVTPQGRAFAQNVLQFFRRAESNELPLPPGQNTSPEDSSAPTAQPPASFTSVAEAERLAGFDAKELPIVPQGFEFVGAMALEGGMSIQYQAQGNGGQLIINESKNGFMQSDWDQAPTEAISQVKIGDLNAEFVQGTYVVYPNGTTAKWNSDAPIYRLRWVEDGIWFELAKFGGVESIEYLDRDGMIALAASLTTDPFPLDMEEVNVHAGFDVLEPSTLPDGMKFLGAAIDPTSKMVSISIGYSDMERLILIKQQPVTAQEDCALCGLVGASASVETVQVGEVSGEYALGVWELTDAGPVWRDDPYLKTLRWQKDGIAFELIYMGTDLEKDALIGIAEDMK